MGVGQLSESDAVDALRLPFYSSSHPTGSHGWRNQFDLGNPEADDCTGSGITALGEQEYGERKQSKVQLNGHWRYQIEYIRTN